MTVFQRAGNALLGDRLRASIDRRVRRHIDKVLPIQLDRALDARADQWVTRAAKAPQRAALIEPDDPLQIKRQLTAVKPDRAEADRAAEAGLLDVRGVRVLRGYSTDPATQALAADRRYAGTP